MQRSLTHLQLDLNTQNTRAEMIANIEASNQRLKQLELKIPSPSIGHLFQSQTAIKNALESAGEIIFAFDGANLLLSEQIAESIRLAEKLVQLIQIRKIDYNSQIQGIVKFNIEQLLFSNDVLIRAMTAPLENTVHFGEPKDEEKIRLETAAKSYQDGCEYIQKNMIPLFEDIESHRKKIIALRATIAIGIIMLIAGCALPASLPILAIVLASVGAACTLGGVAFGAIMVPKKLKPLTEARVKEELNKVPLYNAHHSIFKLKQKTSLIADLSTKAQRKKVQG